MWLSSLDQRSRQWPRIGRASYLTLRWLLIAAGAYAAIGLAVVEYREGRVGLGTGMAVAIALATIKGVLMAVRKH